MNEATVSHFAIKLSGERAPQRLMRDMLECVVENSLHLPDMCSIRIHDADFHWLDSETFEAGTKVEILAGLEGKGELKSIFVGEVVAEEVDMAAQGLPTLMVRCFDKSHRLHRGRKQRSFQNTTDSDIVRKVAAEHGLKLQIEGTKVVHDWIFQNNQTDWEFLQDRAARNGYRLYVHEDDKLKFEKLGNGSTKKVKVEWGKELRSFRPRVTATTQVDEVIVKGWDPKTKNAIVGKSRIPRGTPKTKIGQHGGSRAKRAFSGAKMVVCDRPVQSQTEADEIAGSIMDSIGNTYVEAEGLCYGTPEIRPGIALEVDNIGKKYKGEYTVTSTTHTYTPAEGFSTLFSISGKRAPSLLAQVQGDENMGRTKLGGNIVVGIVTDNRDPDGLGRVKVMYPWLTEDHASFWARVASQMAGGGRGMFNTPEIDDEVLVAFEHGDIHRPYVIGMLWNGKDKPPGTSSKDNKNPILGSGSEVNRRGFTTRIGHTLDFDDTGGKGKVMIKTAGGHVLNLDDAGQCCDLTTTGNHSFRMSDGDRRIEVTTTAGHRLLLDDQNERILLKTVAGHAFDMDQKLGTIRISNQSGNEATMMDSGCIEMKANEVIRLKAPTIQIEASEGLSLSGTTTSVTGRRTNTITGSLVTVSGLGSVVVASPLVKINY